MRDQREWKLAKAGDTPVDKPWWFAPVEDPPNPVKVDGVIMLPVHPASDQDKPWFGFNQRRVVLAVFQDLEPKFSIDHPAPLPVAPPSDARPSVEPANIPSGDPVPLSTAPLQSP